MVTLLGSESFGLPTISLHLRIGMKSNSSGRVHETQRELKACLQLQTIPLRMERGWGL